MYNTTMPAMEVLPCRGSCRAPTARPIWSCHADAHHPGGLSSPRARPYDPLRMTLPPGREFLRARPPTSAAGKPALVNVVTDCKARATTAPFTLYST